MNPLRVAQWLGYAGLIPFVTLALAARLGTPTIELPLLARLFADPQRTLLLYGAIIASFMAGLHWAYALVAPSLGSNALHGRARLFAASVVTPLLVWAALIWLDTRTALALAAAALLLVLAIDRPLSREAWFPADFWLLRQRLTVVAVASLLLAAA